MDPDEPVAPWFDDTFQRLVDGRSAALRRRLAATRVRLASLVAAEHPGVDLTPDLFLDCVPVLVLEANLPGSVAAARAHVSTVSRLVDAAVAVRPELLGTDRARRDVRAARQRVEERAAQRPEDPWAQSIPPRLLESS